GGYKRPSGWRGGGGGSFLGMPLWSSSTSFMVSRMRARASSAVVEGGWPARRWEYSAKRSCLVNATAGCLAHASSFEISRYRLVPQQTTPTSRGKSSTRTGQVVGTCSGDPCGAGREPGGEGLALGSPEPGLLRVSSSSSSTFAFADSKSGKPK